MAVTTEPGLRQARSKDITNEDFAQMLDRIEPAKTPLMTLARTEIKLKAVDRTRNVDSYPGPKGAVGRADNEDAPASGSALSRDWSSNIRKIGNVAQAFSETYRVGWIAGEVPQIAGLNITPEAYARAGAYELIKESMECAAGSFDQVAVYDAGVGLGAVAAGYRALTDYANSYTAASSYAIGRPSDIHYAPTAACIGLSAASTASVAPGVILSASALATGHNRAMWKTLALALFLQVKQKKDWMGLLSPSLRQAVTDLTIPTLAAAGASAVGASAVSDQIRVLLRNEDDNVLGATVDVIQTDFGRFLVTDSMYLGQTTLDSAGAAVSSVNSVASQRAKAYFNQSLKAGLIVEKGNLSKTWAIMPNAEKLGAGGGGDAYDAKALAVPIQVDNPQRCGWLYFT